VGAAGPGGEHASRRTVPGLGNAALASRATAGMLGWHQAEIRHELAGIGEAVMSLSLATKVAAATSRTPRKACRASTTGARDHSGKKHCFEMCLQSVAPAIAACTSQLHGQRLQGSRRVGDLPMLAHFSPQARCGQRDRYRILVHVIR
jgi:hypothetical protein